MSVTQDKPMANPFFWYTLWAKVHSQEWTYLLSAASLLDDTDRFEDLISRGWVTRSQVILMKKWEDWEEEKTGGNT